MAKSKDVSIQVAPIDVGRFEISIRGISPLLQNNFKNKSQHSLLKKVSGCPSNSTMSLR